MLFSSTGVDFSWIAIAGVASALVGCNVEPSTESGFPEPEPTHCADADQDLTCQMLRRGKPFCDLCRPASADFGCAATAPSVPACRVDDGSGTFTSGDSNDTTTSTTDAPTSVDTLESDTTEAMGDTSSGGTSSSSGGPMLPCETPDGTLDQDCMDRDDSRPYCVEQSCVSCGGAGGDAFCGERDLSTPACSPDAGTCAACGDVETFACGNGSPICDTTGACLGCTAHDQCGSGACHLDTDDAQFGACFAQDAVVYVDATAICPGEGTVDAPNCSVAAAMSAVPEGEERVLRLAAGTYEQSATLAVDATVALIGEGGPEISGSGTGASLQLSDGRVYVSRVRLSNNEEGEGIRCANASVRLTSSEVADNADYGIYTTGPCEVRLERSGLFGNDGGGARLLGGTLTLDNSSISANGNGQRGPGINAQYATLDILYSTIAGNEGVGPDSLQCLESEGEIRNSILVGQGDDSIALNCFTVDFDTNAVDASSFAGNGGSLVTDNFNPIWFNDFDGGDYRLGTPPLTPFGGIAVWLDGDPLLDADGTARPQDDMTGYAGVDEPG